MIISGQQGVGRVLVGRIRSKANEGYLSIPILLFMTVETFSINAKNNNTAVKKSHSERLNIMRTVRSFVQYYKKPPHNIQIKYRGQRGTLK